MSRNTLREGIREIGCDPALLLIEVGWRWSFGAIVILICGLSAFLILDSVAVDPRRLQALAALNPLQLAQAIAEGLASVGAVLWRVAFLLGLILAAIWVLFSAVGRYASLLRPALSPGASLQVCLVVSVFRAMLTVASIAAWFVAGLFAGALGSATTKSGEPNFGLMSAVLFLAFVVIVSVWSTLNWFLSFVPLMVEPGWIQCARSAWRFIGLRRDEVLDVSILNGILRAGLLIVAVLLSVAASGVITNVRVLIADLVAIALLYSLIADFLYVARFIAFGKLRVQPVPQPLSAALSQSNPTLTLVPKDAS